MSTLYTLAGAAAVVVALTPARAQQGSVDLAGVWKVSLREQDGVALDFRMTFQMTGQRPAAWEAWSREGAAREVAGGGQAVLGSLLGKLPPHGALVYVGHGTIERDEASARVRGTLESPFLGQRDVDGQLRDGVLEAELRRAATGASAGHLTAVRDASPEPFRNYPALADDVVRTFKANLFNPALLTRKQIQRFFREFALRMTRARDDLDVVGAFQSLVPSLQMSHVGLIRNPTLASRSLAEILEGDAGVNPDTSVRLMIPVPEVAHLRVTRWDRGTPAIDRAFERIQSIGSRVLMLDIRGNPGGDHSSMAALSHLVDTPITVGTFVGRKWYESASKPPSAADLLGLPALSNESTAFELLEQLQQRGAVIGRVVPRPPYFSGKVYLLVDGRTASASEPLAQVLKTTRRATIVGERTAGHMLMALPHALGDSWVMTIPEADFVLPDGSRLEGRGVSPDVSTSSGEVFVAVAEALSPTLPFSAAALRGGTLEALKRLPDAERAYRQAILLVTQQEPRPAPVAVATVRKRLAAVLTARGDRDAALQQYVEVLKLVPGDADALAALRGR